MQPEQLTTRSEVAAWLSDNAATLDRVGPVESAIIRDAYAADELDRLERGTLDRIIATVAGQSYALRFIRPGFASSRRLGYSVEPTVA